MFICQIFNGKLLRNKVQNKRIHIMKYVFKFIYFFLFNIYFKYFHIISIVEVFGLIKSILFTTMLVY